MLCGLPGTRSAGVRCLLLLSALSGCGRVGIELLPEDISGQSARDGGSDATGPSTGNCSLGCENAHGSAICLDGACMIDCDNGYEDCDGDPANGCETNTDSDPTRCGSCGGACMTSTQICVGGTCQASPCSSGRGECDGDLGVMCETDTETSLTNCGFCGNRCVTMNGTPRCTAGSCQVSACAPGYDDCDGSASNGCETAVDTAANCGMCGRSCPASGGTPVCQAGACNTLCNLTGTFALKLSVPASWSGNTYIAAGSGTFEFWMKLDGTHSGNALSGALIECGRSVPPFVGSIIAERNSVVHPVSLFDSTPPRVPASDVTIMLSSASPSAALTLPRSAIQAGVRMADPANGAWPSTASGLTQVDDDGDGEAGITVQYQNTGGYVYPRTSASLTPNRADLAYVASRVAFSLGGTLSSCTQASGAATAYRVDTRIFGCHRASSTQDCTATEASFLDQNIASYSFSPASFTLLKIADGASCATVRSTLP